MPVIESANPCSSKSTSNLSVKGNSNSLDSLSDPPLEESLSDSLSDLLSDPLSDPLSEPLSEPLS